MSALRQAWAELKCLLSKMMDGSDATDSIVVCGSGICAGLVVCAVTVAIAGLFGIKIEFDFQGYGIGAAAILGGMGGGIGARTWMKGQVGALPQGKSKPEGGDVQ